MSNKIKIPYGFKVNDIDNGWFQFFTGKIRVRATLDQVQSKIVDPNIRITVKDKYVTLGFLTFSHQDAMYYTKLINDFLRHLNHERIDKKYSWSDPVPVEDYLPF